MADLVPKGKLINTISCSICLENEEYEILISSGFASYVSMNVVIILHRNDN